MKRRMLRFFSALSAAALLVISLQSHVAFDEGSDDDESKKKEPKTVSCTYTCWFKDNQGQYYYINVGGSMIVCESGNTTCESTSCVPYVPCSTN